MKRFKTVVASFALLATLIFPTVQVAQAAPVDVFNEACRSSNSRDSELCRNRSSDLFGPNSVWTSIVNALIFVVGAAAVVMIIVGGLRYVISNGDQSAITSAKNTILYSVVGLIIAFSAYAIVNFVLRALR